MDARSPAHPDGARFGPAWIGGLLRALLLLLVVAAASVLGPTTAEADYRAKVNAVNTKDAPEIRLRVTFLAPDDTPVNPEFIDLHEVFIDDRRYRNEDVEVGVWAQQPEGTDLVLVLPATRTLGASAFKVIQEAVPEMVKGLGKEDRMALVTYSRSVSVASPLSAEKAAGEVYAGVKRTGSRPFMFSSLNEAIDLLQSSPKGRKKVIIYVGDGTDAATIQIPELNEHCHDVYKKAKEANIQIFTVAYASGGLASGDTRTLQLIARKTGATYREAAGQRQLKERLDQTIGEIVGEIVLKVRASGVQARNEPYPFKVKIQSEQSPEIETAPYNEKIEEVATNWVLVGIVSGLCCILALVECILTVVIIRKVRLSRARKEAEQLLADLLQEREERCETCHRVQKPEWEECLFCAAGQPPLNIQEREPPFVYDEQDRRLCNTCGRVCAMDWQACGFCAQGHAPLPEWQAKKDKEAMMLGQVDPEKLTEQMLKQQEEDQAALAAAQDAAKASASERAQAMAKGGKECPTCKRIMEPHWPECLYCASGLPPLE